ncbi:hypothetical protein L596_023089 [Steinernema carpocapsae]|uniref:Uncharacterized protein n=1 Tax=Steinernema carpocapsae TaxID=34508 RepID=A0A4V5ZZA4_STECR|nr:hypothetical protein L596_023089 [Steinernema carpocapsae]
MTTKWIQRSPTVDPSSLPPRRSSRRDMKLRSNSSSPNSNGDVFTLCGRLRNQIPKAFTTVFSPAVVVYTASVPRHPARSLTPLSLDFVGLWTGLWCRNP